MAVSLKKGQGVSLEKDARPLDEVVMGLGWDAARPTGLWGWLGGRALAVDLDASCVLLDARGAVIDAAWYGQLATRDRSVRHAGDNLTGHGHGDDERIRVRLAEVPLAAATLLFTITSFSGQPFGAVANAFCRLADARSGQAVARYDLGAQGPHTGLVMARIDRAARGWRMTAVGEPGHGRTWRELVGTVRSLAYPATRTP